MNGITARVFTFMREHKIEDWQATHYMEIKPKVKIYGGPIKKFVAMCNLPGAYYHRFVAVANNIFYPLLFQERNKANIANLPIVFNVNLFSSNSVNKLQII
jgi:hypothetical protein